MERLTLVSEHYVREMHLSSRASDSSWECSSHGSGLPSRLPPAPLAKPSPSPLPSSWPPRPASLHRPILHVQTAHPPKLLLVIRNQRQPRRLRMRRNPQIVVSDHLPLALQLRSYRSVSLRRCFRQTHYRKYERQLLQQLDRLGPLRALFCPVHQFSKRNHREHRLPCLQRAKPPQHLLRLFSPDINANVRVQQEPRTLRPGWCCGARRHHKPLRFCGLSFFRSARVKSAGNAASRSNARAIVPVRSLSTISSPRREISTSLLLTRNAFGKRTAPRLEHLR